MTSPPPEPDVTQLLLAIEKGDESAASRLLPVVYEQLRKLARSRMAREPSGHTLEPTALVHEAYLRLVGGRGDVSFSNRAHFFAAAAEAMRRILVERARRRGRLRHGGGRIAEPIDDVAAGAAQPPSLDLVALDEALGRLKGIDRRKADVVTLRFFGGLSVEETASALSVSSATVKNDWSFARAWLHRELAAGDQEGRRE